MGKKMNKDLNLGIVVEAKQEYTRQLCNVLKPIIYETIFGLYTNVVQVCEQPNDILLLFQNELQQIPKWNMDVIKNEALKIVAVCSYLNDLITAIFLSNVRILTSVRMHKESKKKVQIVVPTNESFVHNIYKNVAKNIYNDPYLFSMRKYQGSVTNNIQEVFMLIDKTVEDTIREMLPIENILQSYIGDTMDEDTSVEESMYEDEIEEIPDKINSPDINTINNELINDDVGAMDIEDIDDDVPPMALDNTEKPFVNTQHDDFFGSPSSPEIKDISLEKNTGIVKKPSNFFDDDDVHDDKPSAL
jgi:hypothetical protein